MIDNPRTRASTRLPFAKRTLMGSFRRHPRFVLLALLALAAQITLSFGHLHHRFAHNPQLMALGPTSSQPGGANPRTPSGHATTCIVCWNIQLISSAAFTPLFVFASPNEPCGALFPSRVAILPALNDPRHFKRALLPGPTRSDGVPRPCSHSSLPARPDSLCEQGKAPVIRVVM